MMKSSRSSLSSSIMVSLITWQHVPEVPTWKYLLLISILKLFRIDVSHGPRKVKVIHDGLLQILVVDVHQDVQHVSEVPYSTCNWFLFRIDVSHGPEKVLMVHDELLEVLVVDVHYGDQHVPEVPETICNRFLFKNYSELTYHMALKKV